MDSEHVDEITEHIIRTMDYYKNKRLHVGATSTASGLKEKVDEIEQCIALFARAHGKLLLIRGMFQCLGEAYAKKKGEEDWW